ncbi:RNA polymerase primary sigma factor [Lachnospiraceae bacterium KHCPX20]|nr:RNA polymerase primary sigma factor [Lachnospiraceae bacterium KHCPX20]
MNNLYDTVEETNNVFSENEKGNEETSFDESNDTSIQSLMTESVMMDPVKQYLVDIGSFDLLTCEEELNYTKNIAFGFFAENLLAKLTSDTVTKELINSVYKEEDKEKNEVKTIGNKEDFLSYFVGRTKSDLKEDIAKKEYYKTQLINANLRLVVSIAKKYIGSGLPMLDLIQDGNIGLIRATEKFDYSLNYKFSTYATWWIKQAITRAIADKRAAIRIPVHLYEKITKCYLFEKNYEQTYGRKPTNEEILRNVDITKSTLETIQCIQREQPISADTLLNKDEKDTTILDFIEDTESLSPEEIVIQNNLKRDIAQLLSEFTTRERRIIELRFGFGDNTPKTLEQVGKEFGITRERVRQIEAKVLRKLRCSSRRAQLCDYVGKTCNWM